MTSISQYTTKNPGYTPLVIVKQKLQHNNRGARAPPHHVRQLQFVTNSRVESTKHSCLRCYVKKKIVIKKIFLNAVNKEKTIWNSQTTV